MNRGKCPSCFRQGKLLREDDNDEEGKGFMVKHANSFHEAIAFGRYVGTGAADYKHKAV